MHKARAFFYVCAGLFLLALAYHFGAVNATAEIGGGTVAADWPGTVLRQPVVWLFGALCSGFGLWAGMVLVDPARETLRVVRRIAGALVLYANVHANPGAPTKERMDEASDAYRNLAAELRATALAVPRWARRTLTFVRVLPTDDAIREASQHLIGLSNSLHGGLHAVGPNNSQTADRIRALLRIEAVH